MEESETVRDAGAFSGSSTSFLLERESSSFSDGASIATVYSTYSSSELLSSSFIARNSCGQVV